jgi:hypothetical protein
MIAGILPIARIPALLSRLTNSDLEYPPVVPALILLWIPFGTPLLALGMLSRLPAAPGITTRL